MESRDDWAKILLDGLPPDEREDSLRSIANADRRKLNRIRASLAAEMSAEGASQEQDADADDADDLDEAQAS